MKTSKPRAVHWPLVMVTVLLLTLPISMIGCGKHFVVVKGEETVVIPKATLDTLYSDNELLLQALEECQKK